jgi:hypothetical protein
MQPDRPPGPAGAARPARPDSQSPPDPSQQGRPGGPGRPARPARGSAAGSARRRWPWALALLAIVAAALALVVTPLWIMRPFETQSPAGMAAAHAILRLAPLLSLLALAAAAALAWRLWRATRWLGRTVLAAALLVIVAAAWLARQNVFEWPFPALHHPGYVPAVAAASFVAPGEPVLAIRIQGEAVAYPVRQVAFHHVVEDVVGGTPLVVTY